MSTVKDDFEFEDEFEDAPAPAATPLSAEQRGAIEAVLRDREKGDRIIALTGPAGSGKTTLIRELQDYIDDVEICTPTNKAAQVLISKDLPASTFFKKFFTLEDPKTKRSGAKLRFIPNIEMFAGKEHMMPEGKRTRCDTIIIDEASMVTSRMLSQMQRMAKHIILVGDSHQLPPVGDPDHPAGFFSEFNFNAVLTEVHRQGEGSPILQLAEEVRNGMSPKVERMLRHFQPDETFREWIVRGAMAIVYTNKERRRINHVCRRILGFDQPLPMKGDRMIVANNYNEDLVNGAIVTVDHFDWEPPYPTALVRVRDVFGNTFQARMDMNSYYDDQVRTQQELVPMPDPLPESEETFLELQFAYCITAHKSQGSEWDDVCVFDQLGLIRKITRDDPRAAMSADEMARRWLYTAATRAKKRLAFMPTWWAAV